MKKSINNFTCIKILFISLAFFLIYSNAKGCDCIMQQVSAYVKPSESIIIVKVIENVPLDSVLYTENRKITLEVTKVFKGKIELGERLNFILDGNCDPRFTKEREYLLFGFKKKQEYHIYHCSYSEDLAYASKVIKEVEAELRREKRRQKK